MNINDLNEAAKEIMKVKDYEYLEDKIYAVRVAGNGVLLFTADDETLAKRICKQRALRGCRFCEYASEKAVQGRNGITYITCTKVNGEFPINCVCDNFKRREKEIN